MTTSKQQPKKELSFFQVLGLAIAGLLIFIVFYTIRQNNVEEEIQSAPPVYPSATLTVDELYNEYQANEVRADNKYKGKIIKVSGKINEIESSVFNTPKISLGGEGFLSSVSTTLEQSEISRVANLNRGDSISLQCKCNGMTLVLIVLSDCVIQ